MNTSLLLPLGLSAVVVAIVLSTRRKTGASPAGTGTTNPQAPEAPFPRLIQDRYGRWYIPNVSPSQSAPPPRGSTSTLTPIPSSGPSPFGSPRP